MTIQIFLDLSAILVVGTMDCCCCCCCCLLAERGLGRTELGGRRTLLEVLGAAEVVSDDLGKMEGVILFADANSIPPGLRASLLLLCLSSYMSSSDDDVLVVLAAVIVLSPLLVLAALVAVLVPLI